MDFSFQVPRKILQFEDDGKGGYKKKEITRVVEHYVKECVSGDRKLYKYFKKKYNNVNHEEQFNALPSQEDLNDTIKQFQEDFRTIERGGISSENEQDHGEIDESRGSDADSELRSSEESRDWWWR